jgi:histidinol-phosphate aminotransferase
VKIQQWKVMMNRPVSQDVENLIRPQLLEIEEYSPISPPEVLSQRAGIPEEKLIKLDGNENPYGCSPKVRRALANYSHYHIYPDPEQREFKKLLAEYVGIDQKYIVAGSGSDELIDLILRLFIEPGDEAISCVPSFGMYPFSTRVCGGRIVEVPRTGGFAVDVAAVKAAMSERTKILFLASPNNPTGNLTPQRDILELVDDGMVVVVDEAYYEFSGVTAAGLVPQHDNLIVLRTFSKWAGLAGLRVGYGIFPTKLASHLMKIKPPYNVNAAAQVAVRESLRDIDYLHGTVKAIVQERGHLFHLLEEFTFLKPLPSQANFILCRVLEGNARQICDELSKSGIFIRYFDTPLLKNYIRISVGKPEHTDALIKALRKVALK